MSAPDPTFGGASIAKAIRTIRDTTHRDGRCEERPKPTTMMYFIYLPIHLQYLYQGHEDMLYNPAFAEEHKSWTLTVDGTTYIAVDEVEICNWSESLEINYLGPGAPWIAVAASSIMKHNPKFK